MEMEGKFPRIRSGNGRSESPKVGGRKREEQEDQDEKPGKRSSAALDIASPGGGLLCGWPSSRIVRVSRASGGKDRHSKVWTSKGLRDRRVRLSVNTAIQFYDLQDRLGYDQPSKAVEWLLKAAAASIDELPSINTSFPGQDASDEKMATEMKMAEELYQHHNQQQQKGSNFSKSACSSTSETSKGSGLSLSRCESRMKARERARGRAAEKEKEKEHHNVSQSSFTDLLTGVMVGNGNSPASPNRESPASSRQWCSAPMDYFAAGMLGLSSTPSSSANLLGQIHTSQLFNVPAEHYSFLPDHLASNGTGTGNGCDYNLNFTISPSGYAGFNRGTLQSNSSSIPHQHQRFPSSSSSLFTGATAPPVEDHHHHHFLPGFDARLQLCYGDSDQKGKVKN